MKILRDANHWNGVMPVQAMPTPYPERRCEHPRCAMLHPHRPKHLEILALGR